MCGILGYFHLDAPGPTLHDQVTSALGTIVHRGPDDAGTYFSPDGQVGFGFRRLSIIDLSGGHQPMSNEDGTVWIVFNGEIYNFQSLRADLVARGHAFRTSSDTEVVVHAYEEYGDACVDYLNGMFAFAIWDQRRQRLLLARDRLGIKPLYYTQQDDLFVFASEIKALAPFLRQPLELNTLALIHYLTAITTPAPSTMFRGIGKVPAAHRLVCTRGRTAVDLQRYWEPFQAGETAYANEQECVERVRELLLDSIKLQSIADVPIGILLSSGIDSTTITSLSCLINAYPVHTFSIGFGDATDENADARRIAWHFGATHHETYLSSHDFRTFLPQFMAYQDEPNADAVSVPVFFVCKLARESGVKVVQTGEGADELFCGYPHMVALALGHEQWARFTATPQLVRRLAYLIARPLADAQYARSGGGRMREDWLRRAARDEPYYIGIDLAFLDTHKERLLEKAYADLRPTYGQVVGSRLASLLNARPDADALEQITFTELSFRLPEQLLARADRFSMATSVEARVPFLDHRLVEYVFNLPQSLRIRDANPKWLLKEAIKNDIPDWVLRKPKQGFRVPMRDWMRGDSGKYFRSAVLDSSFIRLGILRPHAVETLFRRHLDGQIDAGSRLWTLANVSLWYDHWFSRSAPVRHIAA